MKTKQNAIELLKEARGASVRVLDGLNARIDRASKQGEPIPVYDGIVELHDLMGKIDAYLSAPRESAMDIVRVPMKMLTEIFNNAVDWVPFGDSERVDEIAAKYGVKVEG